MSKKNKTQKKPRGPSPAQAQRRKKRQEIVRKLMYRTTTTKIAEIAGCHRNTVEADIRDIIQQDQQKLNTDTETHKFTLYAERGLQALDKIVQNPESHNAAIGAIRTQTDIIEKVLRHLQSTGRIYEKPQQIEAKLDHSKKVADILDEVFK